MTVVARLVFVLAVCQACGAQPAEGLPRPTGYVADWGNMLSAAEEQTLDRRLAALEDSTSVQIAVVTVADLGGASAGSLAFRIAREWGVGQRGVNNGALVLLAAAEREIRIEIGTGLEWQIPDSVAAGVVARMVPEFRAGAFARGLSAALDTLAARAGAVPWAVAFESAGAALASPEPEGQVVRLCGAYREGAIVTDAGRAELAFPPHWDEQGRMEGADRVHVVGRVVSATPFRIQTLGLAGEPCPSGR